MTNKKSAFLTFIFSLLPGAGEMYMGFMKQGASLMGLFFTIIALGGWLEIGPIMILLPVIWFYSFFHVHNLRNLSDEEFFSIKDEYIIDVGDTRLKELFGKFHKIIAVVLILMGVNLIWRNIADYIGRFLPNDISNLWYNFTGTFTYAIPQIFVGAGIIYVGIYLIKGKKKELFQQEEQEEQYHTETQEDSETIPEGEEK
ncbi:MAG: hypothetical protein RR364_09240 [Lachnospiraceae bacterium]